MKKRRPRPDPWTKEVLTPGEVASCAKVSVGTAVKWMDDEKLRHYRVPGSSHRRVQMKVLIAFLKETGCGHLVPESLLPQSQSADQSGDGIIQVGSS